MPLPTDTLATKGTRGVHESRGTKRKDTSPEMDQGINLEMIQQKVCLSRDPDLNLLFVQAITQTSLTRLESPEN